MKSYESTLIKFSSDAAFVISAERRITAWNEMAERLLGFTAAEAIGRDCGDLLHATLPGGEPLCHTDCDVFNCFAGCRPYGVPSCLLEHRNGDWVAASMASIALPQKGIPGVQDLAIIFLRDVAASKLVPAHQTLQIFTLGGFGMVLAGQSIDFGKWKRKRAVTLLKLLVTQLDRSVHRERLLDCLWPDVNEKQGWGRLKVTMYYLRNELRANGISDDVIKTIGSAYVLKRSAVWVDAQSFERLFEKGREQQKQGQLDDALVLYIEAEHLYRGDYFEEEIFEDWCAEERERLRELYLEMLTRMTQCYSHLGKYTESIQICRKALVMDQCRESTHFALMDNLVRNGHPELALAQYRQCEQILAREFGIAPLKKIQRLYEQIVKGEKGIPDSEKHFG